MENYLELGSEDQPRPKKKKKPHSGYEFEGENGFAEFGGYMDAKISKLDQQFAANKDSALQESNLFAGISIFVNGLTNPSSGELKLIMMKHGGTFHTYERSHTSYIIASNLPDVKIRNHSVSRTIIRPEWITKCLEEKRIVDYAPYLLVTKRNHQQPRIMFNATKKPSETEDFLDNGSDLQAEEEFKSFDPKLLQNQTEEKNGIPKNQARTANDPNFLSEFYNNSRLHHISTMGATFKQHISNLRENHSGDFPGRQALINSIQSREPQSSTHIMHIDMDCFFVSVGLRNRPELIGKPIGVTHSKGNSVQVRPGADLSYENKAFRERFGEKFGGNTETLGQSAADRTLSLSEIASCSYEARAKGVKNGMFVGAALKLCPDLKTIPYDFEGYKEVAFTLYSTIAQYTLDIEAVSCDEMYVDLTSLLSSTGIPVLDFVTYVREEIKAKTGCPCSAGIGSNRIQARMATKRAKPNGQFHLTPDTVTDYFRDISVNDLPGVGRSTASKLEKKNWRTCGDLQLVPLSLLQQELGKKFGETIHQLSFGRDDKPLIFDQCRKSVSAEVNYGIRFKDTSELETFLTQLCGEVENRLKDARRKGKCVTLKYMVRAPDAPVETAKFMGHGICDVVNKSLSWNEFTSDAEVIKRAVLQLNAELNIPPEELRGIGIQVTKLDGLTGDGKVEVKDSRLMEMFSKVQQKNQEKKKEALEVLPEKERIELQPKVVISPAKKTKTPPKRGRPKKGMKAVKTKNISELLRSNPDDVDQDVLNELPEEFREEAIRSHRLMKRFNSDTKIKVNEEKKSTIQVPVIQPPPTVDEDFLAALPPDIRREVELEMGLRKKTPTPKESSSNKLINNPSNTAKKPETLPEVSEDNIFVQNDWRTVLTAWISASEVPDDCDMEFVVRFWKELIFAKRIEDVYLQLRFFRRMINSTTNCGWHRMYNLITTEIQEAMVSVLSRKLAIHDQVNCNKCTDD